MRLFLTFICICFLGCSPDNATVTGTNNSGNSDSIYTSAHFKITYMTPAQSADTRAILKVLEDNYGKVVNDIFNAGNVETVNVKIWGSSEVFYSDMQRDVGTVYVGATGYVRSAAEVRVLFYNTNQAAQVALHEWCHAVTLKMNSRFGNNPRWLWEASAIYAAGEFYNPKNIPSIVAGNFPTLAALNTGYNSGPQNIYQLGYILSEYIISEYGINKFRDLIIAGGNLSSVLNITAEQFEIGWKNFVQQKYLN